MARCADGQRIEAVMLIFAILICHQSLNGQPFDCEISSSTPIFISAKDCQREAATQIAQALAVNPRFNRRQVQCLSKHIEIWH
jgi:hypothetical protein